MIQQLYDILGAMRTAFVANGWDNLLYLGQKRENIGDNSQTGVFIPQKQDDFISISPTDTKGNYAYIRTLDNAPRFANAKLGSCNSIRATYSLRLVGVWNDSGVLDYSLFDKLIADLNHFAAYNKLSSHFLKIEPLQGFINANEIYNDELGVDMQMRNLALAAVNFTLEFILKNCNSLPQKCPVDVVQTPCN